MHAYEEITKARSWRIIASHPDHARHETQESGSFTLSGLRSRTSKALRLTALYHQSEHSRGPTSFPFPSSSARSVARTARCLGDNSNSQTLISGEASLGMFGLPQRGKGAEVESILCSLCFSAPLRQSRVSLQLSDANGSAHFTGQGIGVSDPVPAFKRQNPRVSPHSHFGNRFQV